MTGNNFIAANPSKTEFGCIVECSITSGCQDYTWYSSENDNFQDECILYSSCDTLEPCQKGCYSGSVDCDSITTTPEPDSTISDEHTTTPENKFCNEINYMILDDSTRNIQNGDEPHSYCDTLDVEVKYDNVS